LLGLRIYSLALFPLAFSTVFSIALRGSEQMGAYALLSLASVLLQVGVVLTLPTLNIPSLAVWLTIAQCVVALVAGVLCIQKIPGFQRGWQFSTPALRPLLVSAAPIALLALLGILYQKLGIYLLSSFAGAAITGSFAVALRAVEASKTIHNSVFTALYPAMARAEADSTSAYRLAWVPLLAGALLISLLLSVFAGPFVSVLFGLEFAPSGPALRILAWILVPYTLNTYLTLAFLVAKKERRVAAASFGSLLSLLLLSIWWIPTRGLLGAAWAALVAECLQAFLLWAQRGFHLAVIERGEPHELSELS
jgi:O-antigen/teichoic acid export membrane protein